MNHNEFVSKFIDEDSPDGRMPQDPASNRFELAKQFGKECEEMLTGSDTNVTVVYMVFRTNEPSVGFGRLGMKTVYMPNRKCTCDDCHHADVFNMASHMMWMTKCNKPALFEQFLDQWKVVFDAMDKNKGEPLA